MTIKNTIPCLLSIFGVLASASNLIAAPKTKIPKRAAIVKHIGDSSRGPYAVLESGANRGFTVGIDICFFNMEDEETGCGTIEQSSPKASGVRLPAGKPHAVSEGQRAWAPMWGKVPAFDGSASEGADDEVSDLIEEEQEENPEIPSVFKHRMSYNYLLGLKLPVTTHGFKFDAAARVSGTGSVWTTDASYTRSLVGFSVIARIPKPGRWDRGYGFAYNFLPQTPVKSDFDLTDGSTWVTTTVSAHFYRFHASTGFSLLKTNSFDLLLDAGFELVAIVHRFSAEYSEGTSFAQGTLINGMLMLPFGPIAEWKIGGWILNFSTDFYLPVYMKGNKVSGIVGYDEETPADKDLNSIKDAIAPKKTFGYGVRLGLGGEF
ncbi:MAG: hypothetical protein NT027_20795 [Proteobacteria bacterium]|nr:hypothetical protein [Pseudomonadota bacterium]